MSRSYKKSPVYTDGSPGTTKEWKRIAQKKVRKCNDLPMKGNAYKKVFESYYIHDYIEYRTWEDAKRYYELIIAERDPSFRRYYVCKRFPTMKEYYRSWLKDCKMK